MEFLLLVAAVLLSIVVFCGVLSAIPWNRMHPALRISSRFLGDLNLFVTYWLMTFPIALIAAAAGGIALPGIITMGGSALVIALIWLRKKTFAGGAAKAGAEFKRTLGHGLLLATNAAAIALTLVPFVLLELGIRSDHTGWTFVLALPLYLGDYVVWTIGIFLIGSSADFSATPNRGSSGGTPAAGRCSKCMGMISLGDSSCPHCGFQFNT